MEASELFIVKGLVVVVTGGGSGRYIYSQFHELFVNEPLTGIGRAMAKTLAANGAERVYILGRRVDILQKCALLNPKTIVPLQCDVTSKPELQDCANRVQQEVGYINLLICNSGVAGPGSTKLGGTSNLDDFISINWEQSTEDYIKTFQVNTVGYWYTTLAFLKLLHLGNENGNISQRSQVVATCSTLAFNRLAPTSMFAYGQSKAASTHMMKQLSTVLAPYHIRANILAPGCKQFSKFSPQICVFTPPPQSPTNLSFFLLSLIVQNLN